MLILNRLVQPNGLRRVYLEGLTNRNAPIFRAKVAALRKVRAELDDLRHLTEEAHAPTEQLDALERQFRQDLLQIGAAGRLLMADKIEAVLPLEDAKAYEAASEAPS